MKKRIQALASGQWERYISLLWLGWILTAATKRLVRFFPPPDAELNGDAYWTYLPNARRLIEHPWTFLTSDPSSYHVAPLGYLWPAIWGADAAIIQLANCFLFLACVLLMWHCGKRLGGAWAGAVATALLVYHPELISYVPQVLTESIYLFGLMLCLAACTDYVMGTRHPRLALTIAAVGLAITLLSRPVLQIFVLAATVISITGVAYLTWQRRRLLHPLPGWSRFINHRVAIALLAALALPTLFIVKNGACFGVWSLSTGAGSGLYYGVSPFKMGLEPVYSGFKYDAGITPLKALPETKGHPLTKEADRVNALVALNIIRQTSLQDNVLFFAQKLKAWMLYSTPELTISPKLRMFRLFEWFAICTAIFVLAWRMTGRRPSKPAQLSHQQRSPASLIFLLLIMVLACAMALQLTPVLYNTRYNTFFIEPWLMLLCGVSVAIVFQPYVASQSSPASIFGWISIKLPIMIALAGLSVVITKFNIRHESLSMDPYRPGPVATILGRDSIGTPYTHEAESLGNNNWRIVSSPASFSVPLHIVEPENLTPEVVMDALWRIRIAIDAPNAPRKCAKAKLAVSPAYALQDWYEPEPSLTLRVDGQPHTYAIHGNDQLRPSASGTLTITLSCPAGAIVTWAGAELLRSTLPESARALIQDGTPIDPYFRSEPR